MKNLYISGYNGGTKPSIQLFNLEPSELWAGYVDNASFLSIHEDELFGISELDGESQVHLYQRNQQGYELIHTKPIPGGALCHISYLSKHRVLAGACYEDGKVFTVRVEDNGFGEFVSFIKQGGENVGLTRAHCVVPNKKETLLYSANIALDRIYCYRIVDGALIEYDLLQLPKGEGPRHIQLSPDENQLYVITEYSNKIHRLRSMDGRLEWLDSISTLPEGFTGESFGSSICMSADGRRIYGANRGASTIAVFNVLEEGGLEKTGDCFCHGDWPRHIALVDNESQLAIANQRSSNVVLCNVDPESGLLTKVLKDIPFENVSFVCEGDHPSTSGIRDTEK